MQASHRNLSPARDSRLYHRLQLASHAAQKSADRAVGSLGVTTAQLAVLAVISADAPMVQRHVAERLGVNESAVTAMVVRLVGLGLVVRQRDRSDRRVRTLSLTPSGRTALADADRTFASVNTAIDRALTATEVEALADLLDRVRLALQH